MEIYVDDSYMFVSEDEGILTLRWKKETATLTDEEFKNEALQFIDVVRKLQSKKILVDMRDFCYTLGPDVLMWRKEHIITMYNEIGVERFAFLSENPTVHQADPANTFITRYFSSKQEARDWLCS